MSQSWRRLPDSARQSRALPAPCWKRWPKNNSRSQQAAIASIRSIVVSSSPRHRHNNRRQAIKTLGLEDIYPKFIDGAYAALPPPKSTIEKSLLRPF